MIQAFETWAHEYQRRNTYEGESGTVVPKASINAIRSGYPFNLTSTRYLSSRDVGGYARVPGPARSAWPLPPAVDGPGGVAPERARGVAVAG